MDAGVDVDAAVGGGHAAAGPPTGGGASTPATHPTHPTASHTDTPRRGARRGVKRIHLYSGRRTNNCNSLKVEVEA